MGKLGTASEEAAGSGKLAPTATESAVTSIGGVAAAGNRNSQNVDSRMQQGGGLTVNLQVNVDGDVHIGAGASGGGISRHLKEVLLEAMKRANHNGPVHHQRPQLADSGGKGKPTVRIECAE